MTHAHSVARPRMLPGSWHTWIVLLVCMISLFSLPAFAASSGGKDFDHARTGFQLSGSHRNVRCESCHVQGIFKGTPTLCSSCHSSGGQRATTSTMPSNHIPTKQACESCHNTVSFSGANFKHTGVAPGSCATCHNGNNAKGKPSTHIATTATCDTCHKTNAWTPASFNHGAVAPGSCASCHNGKTAIHQFET